MAFDVEGYRKAAKEAGFSDAEIQKDIDEETQGIAAKGADADMANVKVGKDFMGIPEFLQPSAGLATALGAGAVLGGLGLKGVQKLKERMGSQPQPTARVEPTFGIPDVETFAQPQNTFTPPQSDVTDVASRPVGADRTQITGPAAMPEGPAAPPAAAPAAVAPLTDKQRREKAMADLAEHKLEEARKASAAKEIQQAEGKKQTTTSSGGVNPADRQMLNSSENAKIDKALSVQQKAAVPPPAPVAAPIAATPELAPTPAPIAAAAVPPSNVPAPIETQTTAVTETPKKPAKSKAIPAYKTPADVPEGMVFRPDVGNLDRSLVNILGTEGRLYAKDVLNEGKMFGDYKGGDYNKKVSDLVGAYGEELKKITPSIDLTTRDGRVAAGLPQTQNYGPALGKAAKVGGVLGTLMTVAQSANAKEALGNVAESLLPIGMTPSELQTGKLTAKQLKAYEEAQKLGSPYRSVPPPKK